MFDITKILTEPEIGKMIIEDAIKYAFERKLYIRVCVYGSYYKDFCIKYLLEPSSAIGRKICMAKELKGGSS